jgi:hypothetical protein
MPPLAANGGSSLEELELRWSKGRARERVETRAVGGGDDDFSGARRARAVGDDSGPEDDGLLYDPAGDSQGARADADDDEPKKRERLGWKLTLVLFLLAVFTCTDLFAAGFIAPIGHTTRVDGQPNTRGVIVQALMLVALFSLVIEGVRTGLF